MLLLFHFRSFRVSEASHVQLTALFRDDNLPIAYFPQEPLKFKSISFMQHHHFTEQSTTSFDNRTSEVP
jgi:hypothetical protein